jgi:hypothetical protein
MSEQINEKSPLPDAADVDHPKKNGIADKTKGAVKKAVDAMTEASHMRDTMKGPPGPEDD